MSAPDCKFAAPSVKQQAKQAGVSERMMYMCRKILRLRPDLGELCLAGQMSANAALCIIEAKPAPTTWDRLVRAWNAASDDDRERLLVGIGWREASGGTPDINTKPAVTVRHSREEE